MKDTLDLFSYIRNHFSFNLRLYFSEYNEWKNYLDNPKQKNGQEEGHHEWLWCERDSQAAYKQNEVDQR